MKRAVIFLHGDKPSKESMRRIRKSHTIICADGGAKYAVALGITPHIYIGDRDSISPTFYKKLENKKVSLHIFPKDKDKTDSELAVEYAIHKGYREILILGVVGSRVDHMIANLSMFADKCMEGVQIQVEAEKQTLYFVHDKLELFGRKGEYVSLIPIKGDSKGVTTKGLKWQIYNDTLYFGKTLGISNEFAARKASIEVSKGILMVIHTKR